MLIYPVRENRENFIRDDQRIEQKRPPRYAYSIIMHYGARNRALRNQVLPESIADL